ncbi:MAG: alpha/beta fold hydrolase [Verrucomicrobiales bacterium]|nr:alpha/beta fold hydrolase [Verrucomicrobiales bacterium]
MSGLLLVTFTAIALVIAVIWLGSSRFIIPKRRALEPRHRELLANPAEFGLSLEPIELQSCDGFTLQGIIATRSLTPGRAVRTRAMQQRLNAQHIPTPAKPRGTIFLLHGRGGRKEDMLSIAQRLVAADFRCVVYDARAHGTSKGKYCTFGTKEVPDLESAITQIESHLEEKGESSGPVALFGNSLGAAVSIQSLALEEPPFAVFAAAPFANLPEIVIRSGRRMIHPKLPDWVTLCSMKTGAWRAGFDPFHILPETIVKKSGTPLFVTHGSRDGVIPLEHGRRIYEGAATLHKVWREFPDAFHNDVLAVGGDDLYEEMVMFYLRHLPR